MQSEPIENLSERLKNVYNLFVDYYGEENVDIQKYTEDEALLDMQKHARYYNNAYQILVKWDTVEVKNEYDKSIVIWGLYAKIIVTSSANLIGTIQMCRDTYNDIQWKSNYVHSHVQRITSTVPNSNRQQTNKPIIFSYICLGDGPLVSTCTTLQILSSISQSYEDIWRLFIWELDKYVHVESVAGTPYHKLESVGLASDNNILCNTTTKRIQLENFIYFSSFLKLYKFVNSFIKYLCTINFFKFNYANGVYDVAMSFNELVINISNAFIDWFNDKKSTCHTINYSKDRLNIKIDKFLLYQNNMLCNCYVDFNNIYHIQHSNIERTNIVDYVGKYLFDFKNKKVLFKRISQDTVSRTNCTILHPIIIGYILYTVLKIVNYEYKGSNAVKSTATTE